MHILTGERSQDTVCPQDSATLPQSHPGPSGSFPALPAHRSTDPSVGLSPVNVCITVRLSCRNTSPTSLPFPPLGLTALISRLGCCLDSSLGEAVNPPQDAAEVCSECALPGWIYGTVRHLQPPPACCSRESVLWLLQLRAGQADVSLAADAVGFVMVMCVCVCVHSAGLLLGSSRGLTPAGGSAHDSQPETGSVCWFAACQLPPVYLFNCFGCFFPLPLGVCLPRLSTGSPRRRVPGTASLPEPALCPPNVRLGQTCAGRAEPPCAGIAGGGPACPSGVSAPPVPKPEATAEPAPGRATASTRTLCPALREPAYLSGENAGPGSKTSSNEG